MGNVTRYEYANGTTRVTKRIDPLGKQELYEYDNAGNLVKVTDRMGRVKRYAFDANNMPVQETWIAATGQVVKTINAEFNPIGQLVSASDEVAGFSFGHETGNRVAQVDTEYTFPLSTYPLSEHRAFALNYAYNDPARATTITDDQGVGIESILDERGLEKILRWSGGPLSAASVQFGYNDLGDALSIERFADFAGAVPVGQTQYQYGDLRRLVGIAHKDSADATILANAFGYDDAGQLTSETFTDPLNPVTPVQKQYRYDLTGQLTQTTTDGADFELYDYDDNGNRLSADLLQKSGATLKAQYTVTSNNRYSQIVIDPDGASGPEPAETWNMTYDDEGNLIAKISATYGTAWTYRYDHRNRLTHIDKREALDTTLIVEFTYDLFDRRVAKRVEYPTGAGQSYSRVMLYAGDMIWREAAQSAAGVETTRYLTGQSIDQWVAKQTTYGPQPTASQAEWFLDEGGSVRATVDNEGNVLTLNRYNAFGRPEEASSIRTPQLASAPGYTGREYDAETGLYYYRARYYDPVQGRFMSQDPIGYSAGDSNLYR
jgi:RHS repeat-associated protein